MRNFKVKDKVSVSLLTVLTGVFVLVNPGDAFADLLGCMQNAADQGIFKTMACKITTTLFDIRKIVYIIGGLGLVAFTFAAIFNKISFKHLANIALSLFLLSMITPFIEYFTQAEGYTLTYGSFLQPNFTEDDYSMTFGECEGSDCPISTTVASGSSSSTSTSTSSGLTVSSSGELTIAETLSSTVTETLSTGGTEVDTRTGWQKFKDTISSVTQEGLKAYNTATTVVSTAGSVYNAVNSTVNGFKGADGISGVITASVGAFNNYSSATSAITSGAGMVGTYYLNTDGEETLGQKVDNFFSSSNKSAQEGKKVTQDIGTINATVEATKDLPDYIQKVFK